MNNDAQWSLSGTPRSPNQNSAMPDPAPPEAPAQQVVGTPPPAEAPKPGPAKGNQTPQSPVVTPEQVPGECLSREAINKRLQRIFKPRADGSFLVSEEFIKKWQNKGSDRDQLLVMFEKCDYDPDRVGENLACFQFPQLPKQCCFNHRMILHHQCFHRSKQYRKEKAIQNFHDIR